MEYLKKFNNNVKHPRQTKYKTLSKIKKGSAFGFQHFEFIQTSNTTLKFCKHLKRNKSKTW